MNPAVRGEEPTFDHVAVVYDSASDLRDRVAVYLREEVHAYDRVLVAVPPATEQILRGLVDVDATAVEWGLPKRAVHRLGHRYAGLRRHAVTAHAAGDTTLIVSEFDGDRTDERMMQYLRYEAACNESFAWYDSTMLCLGNQSEVGRDLLTEFQLVHPRALANGHPVANTDYLTPEEYLTRYIKDGPPPPPGPPHLDHELTTIDQLAWLRQHVRTWTHVPPVNLDIDDTEDITAAIDEIATNALKHGRPPVRIRGWVVDHQIIVHVDDHGTTGIDPTTGYYLPGPEAQSGRGLCIARHIADTLTTHTTPAGTTVRLTFPVV